MLRFLKENGYPVDLEFKTGPYEEEEEDFHGYKTDIFVDGILYDHLIHSDFRARVHYANGFFAAYRWESTGQYKWRGKEKARRKDGILDVQVGDWIVTTDHKIKRVDMDSQPDLPYKKIKRFASEAEAEHHEKVNELIDTLEKMRENHSSDWDTYGSELCAGDMIGKERAIQEQIDKLSKDEN